MSKLKPCPFCNSPAVMTASSSNSYCPGSYKVAVSCSKPACVQMNLIYTPARWIKYPEREAKRIAACKWNKRYNDDRND